MRPDRKIYFFITKLWEKSIDFSHLSFLHKVTFYLFHVCEFFYQASFFCVIFVKKRLGGYDCSPAKVISVGNLSVGGTGKSVFVKFLAAHLPSSAIISRGYGKDHDEAKMLSQSLAVPVMADKNRRTSAQALKKSCKYLLLDDAYQNYQLKKDCEILLLDARSPFGNGHCLPAGPLREKDFSRADVIVLTHADEVEFDKIKKIKNNLQNFSPEKIFTGKHDVCGVLSGETGELVVAGNKRFFAVAGIGSFSGFLLSLKKSGVRVGGHCEYPDHVSYTKHDVEKILENMGNNNCHGIITTQKDWVKLRSLVGDNISLFYILEITFRFLSQEERESFFTNL